MVQDVECPECGCGLTRVINERDEGSHAYQRRRCSHCAFAFDHWVKRELSDAVVVIPAAERKGASVDLVIYQPLKCPQCSSTNIIKTGRGNGTAIDYYKCRAEGCGKTFGARARVTTKG